MPNRSRHALVGLVLIAALFASGCGFRPLYGSSSGVAAALSGVQVETSEGRPSYLLGVALRDRLGSWEGSETRYVLRTTATTGQTSTALTIDQVAARTVLSVNVNYALYDSASGAMLTSGAVTGQATYDVPPQPYATIRVEQDATERATQDAADRLAIALARFVHDREAAQDGA